MPRAPLWVLTAGELSLVVCSICYVLWWALAFRPPITVPRPVGQPFLVGAAVFGTLGTLTVLVGAVWTAVAAGSVAIWAAFAAALAGGFLYRVLYGLTTGPLQRSLTTELPLIVLWTTAQAIAWAALTRGGLVTGTPAVLGWVVIAATLGIGLACYVAFYRLPPVPAYVAGMVPLAVAGVACGVLAWIVHPT